MKHLGGGGGGQEVIFHPKQAACCLAFLGRVTIRFWRTIATDFLMLYSVRYTQIEKWGNKTDRIKEKKTSWFLFSQVIFQMNVFFYLGKKLAIHVNLKTLSFLYVNCRATPMSIIFETNFYKKGAVSFKNAILSYILISFT